MAKQAEIQVLINAKDNASKTLSGIGDSAKKLGSKFRNVGKVMSLALTAPIVGFGALAVREFAIAEGAQSKFNVVFGKFTDEMNDFVDDLRNNMPLARSEIVQAAAGLQDLLVPMGIVRSDAKDMTKKWLVLANQLAAFNDVPVDEVLMAIRSGIVGQSEPLRKFGIDARTTSLEAIALQKGILKVGESFAEVSPKVRAQATAAALLEQATLQSKDAIEGFEEQQGSLLLKQEDLKASTKDLMAIIGEQLAPAVAKIVDKLIEWAKAFSELSPRTRTIILVVAGIVAVLGPLLIILGLVASAIGGIIGLAAALGIGLLPLIGIFAAIVAGIAAVIAVGILVIKNWDTIKAGAIKVFNFIVSKINWFKDNWAQAIGFIIAFVATLPFKLPILIGKAVAAVVKKIMSVDWGKVWKGVQDAAIRVFDFIKNIRWGDILVSIGKGIANAIIGLIEGAIKGAVSGIPVLEKLGKGLSIPRFAEGTGFSPTGPALVGERGPELVDLPGGSKVTPAGVTGDIFNVTINVGTLIDSDNTRRNFAERLMQDFENIAVMKGKKVNILI